MAITTVVKTIGSGGDFTTLQSWEDAKPLDLTDSRSSTTQAGSTSSTIALDVSASATTGAYVGHAVYCTARPAEKRLITAYDGTSKVATVGSLNGSSATWVTTPGTEAFTIDQCIWQGQIKNATDYFVGAQFANVLTISGSTSSSACSTELTTAPGASWRDNATVATNALRYNPSNGCAIEGTPAFAKVIETAEYAHLSNLQCFATATGGATDSFSFTNTIVQNCILDFDADQARCCNGGSLINCLIVSRGNSPTGSIGVFVTPGASTSNIIGCTIVNSKANGYIGVGRSYFSVNIQNCAIFGFLNSIGDFGGTPTWTITTCATDCSTAAHPGWTFSIPYSTATFQNVTEATRDYRLVSGSGLIGIGTTDSTNQPIDIRGTTRPQGTGYDIGCWEFAAPPSHESYLAFDGNPNTYAISAQLLTTEAYWIKIDLGSPFLVDSYKYQARADGVFNAWKTWILEGSNNNSTWTLVDTVTNEANFTAGQTRSYVCDAPGTYRYWRWTVTASEGLYADVAGLELYNNQLAPPVTGALAANQANQTAALTGSINVPNFLPNTWTTHSGSTLSGTGIPFTLLEDASNGEHFVQNLSLVPLPIGDYCLSFEFQGVGPHPRGANLNIGTAATTNGVNLSLNPDGSLLDAAVYGAGVYVFHGYTIAVSDGGYWEGRLYFSVTTAFTYDIGFWLYGTTDPATGFLYQGLNDGSGIHFRSAVLTKNYLTNAWLNRIAITLTGTGQPFTELEDASFGAHMVEDYSLQNNPGDYALSFEYRGNGPTPRTGALYVFVGDSGVEINVNPDGSLRDDVSWGTGFTTRDSWITAKSDGFWDCRLYFTATIPFTSVGVQPSDAVGWEYQGLNDGSGLQFRNAALVVDVVVEAVSITGTLSRIEASDTISSIGRVLVSAPLSQNQAAQTVVAAGGVRVGATLGVIETSDILVAAGSPRVAGTLAIPQSAQTIVAAGGPRVGSTLGVIESSDTIVATGSPRVGGILTTTEALDTIAATGSVIAGIGGALSIVQANNTLSATVTTLIGGILGIIEATDTISASGGVVVRGALTSIEVTDTISASGGPIASASLTANQAAQTLSSTGAVTVGGILGAIQASNTLVANASSVVRGTLSLPEINDTLVANGTVFTPTADAVGALQVIEQLDTIVAKGNVPVIGALGVIEAVDTIVAAGGPVARGILNTIQASNTLSATAGSVIGGALSTNQAAQTLSASGRIVVGGILGVIEATDTIVSAGNVRVSGALSVIEATDTIVANGSVLTGTGANLNQIQANNTLAAAAAITGTIGVLNVIEQLDTLSAVGRVTVGGALTSIQAYNTLVASASIRIGGILGVVEATDTINAFASLVASGTLSKLQTNDTVNARADAVASARLAAIQSNNSVSATGLVADVVTGVLARTQDDNLLEARGSVSFTTIPPSFPIYGGETNGRYIVTDKQDRVVVSFPNRRTIISERGNTQRRRTVG